MERSGTEVSDLGTGHLCDIVKALKELLFSQLHSKKPRKQGKTAEKENKCVVCLGGGDPGSSCAKVITPLSEDLSDQLLQVLFSSLLVPSKDEVLKCLPSPRILKLCEECSCLLKTLRDLVLQLEELRKEFNYFRRRLGHQMIVSSLGKGEETYEKWEEEVKKVEHLFPSPTAARDVDVVKVKEESPPDDDEDLSEYILELLESDDNPVPSWRDDVKLKKMTPVVVLNRVDETREEEEMEVEILEDMDIEVIEVFSPEDAEESTITPVSVTSVTSQVQSRKPPSPKKKRKKTYDYDVPKEPLKCPHHPHCTATFLHPQGLAVHMKRAHPENTPSAPRVTLPHACPTCTSSFSTSGGLNLHIRLTHNKLVPHEFQCHLCPAMFPTAADLLKHRSASHSS